MWRIWQTAIHHKVLEQDKVIHNLTDVKHNSN